MAEEVKSEGENEIAEVQAPAPWNPNFVANPIAVRAFQIAAIGVSTTNGVQLTLNTGETVTATFGMTARYQPTVGDYWVIQEDGYIYLNPKTVFERKYSQVV